MSKKLLCRCASYQHIDTQALKQHLNDDTIIVDDLCLVSARSPEKMQFYSQCDEIVACHERAIKALFQRHGLIAPKVIDVRQTNLQSRPIRPPEKDEKWEAWYPVIDQDLCINCEKCISFCMFGVYASIDKKVVIIHPDQCKTNCPACARMCPKQAIIFPKYNLSPIDGGESDTQNNEKPLDMLSAIRARNQATKSLFKDETES